MYHRIQAAAAPLELSRVGNEKSLLPYCSLISIICGANSKAWQYMQCTLLHFKRLEYNIIRSLFASNYFYLIIVFFSLTLSDGDGRIQVFEDAFRCNCLLESFLTWSANRIPPLQGCRTWECCARYAWIISRLPSSFLIGKASSTIELQVLIVFKRSSGWFNFAAASSKNLRTKLYES